MAAVTTYYKQWLKTTKISSLTVLEARSPRSITPGLKSMCGLRCIHRLEEKIHALPGAAAGGCQHSLACSRIAPTSSNLSLFHLHTASFCVWGGPLCLSQDICDCMHSPASCHLKTLYLIISVKTFFPKMVTLTYSRD